MFLLLLIVVFLTGCWDRKELNEIGIVVGVALDEELLTKEMVITCEVIKAPSLKNEGVHNTPPVQYISGKGATVFDAVRNCSKKFDRKIFFSHNKIIVINEKIAREGLASILDVFMRDYETRPLVWLLISKNSEASEILKVNHGIETIQALYLRDIIKKKWATSEVQVSNIVDFYKNMIGSGTNPITGAVEIVFDVKGAENTNDIKNISLCGTAVFKKDKLIGYLNDRETRGFNWITGGVKSGIVNVPGLINNNKLISIEIKEAKRKINVMVKKDNINFNIQVNEKGNIGEVQDSTDIIDLKSQTKIEKEQEKAIVEEIKAAISRAKNDFHCDIFGLGNILYRSNFKQWKRFKEKWDDYFVEAQLHIEVNVVYQRVGETLKPFDTK
jgi:germination protein, Ger(x)C family